MRVAFLPAILLLSTLLSSAAPQTSPPIPQALQILEQSLTALNGKTVTRDVTLSASVRYVTGSDDDETGTATLKAVAAGASRIDLSLSSGTRSEVQNLVANPPTGSWSGPDGTTHAIAPHNLLGEPAWFSPVTAITRHLNGTGWIVAYVGPETLDSQNVQHISVTKLPPQDSSSQSELLAHLTQVDLYIDSTTFLPAAMSFNTHPDNNALVDIPVDVRFSDYHLVNGAQVPFHIQKFLNKGLFLDLQVSSTSINTGLSSSDFGVS
jgi:hypothetical protein